MGREKEIKFEVVGLKQAWYEWPGTNENSEKKFSCLFSFFLTFDLSGKHAHGKHGYGESDFSAIWESMCDFILYMIVFLCHQSRKTLNLAVYS